MVLTDDFSLQNTSENTGQIPGREDLLGAFQKQRPLRGGSLIITVFGDSISQYGVAVWLGSLIEALEPFGLNQRLVRTSVYRLIQEGWLDSNQVGRRSYYRFTDFGLRQYQKAARRIYVQSRQNWDGNWTLVMPAYVVDEAREQMRKELAWAGFGQFTGGVLAHPGAECQSLDETLQELDIHDKVVVMKVSTEDLLSQSALKQLSVSCWNLDQLEARYIEFLKKFRPLQGTIPKNGPLDPKSCFQLCTLLVHEYRRILLKDSDLPQELLPNDWSGNAAQLLTASIYKRVHHYAKQYLCQIMEMADGLLPEASASYYSRFGELND